MGSEILQDNAETPASGSTAPNDGEKNKMTQRSVIILTLYLSGCVLLSFYMVYALWSAQPLGVSGPMPPPGCTQGTAPTLSHIYPLSIPVGTAQDLWLVGCGFTEKTQVKLNGAPHQALYLDASHIRVGLTAAELASPGPILAALSNGGPDFGTGSASMIPATVMWQPFWSGPRALHQEVQVLLLVIFVGMLGSTVYALKSMADYRGDNLLGENWFMYYGIQPFEGPGIAFLVYLVIRGGLLAGTSADIKSANLFGICAFAGLAGTFSDIAFMKLREVFESLFRAKDDRGGKRLANASPSIATKTLKPATVGQAYQETLSASGGIAPLQWSVSPALPEGLSLDASSGVISGTPTANAKKAVHQFTVADSSASPLSTTIPLELEVREAGAAGASAATPGEDADGCDVAVADSTPDEELPATEGGVA